MEILVPTTQSLVSLDASTGTVDWEFPMPSVSGQEPFVRDIDGDGHAEILIGAADGRMYVLGPKELRFEPRTIGYWKHQCTVSAPRGDHLGIPPAYIDAIRSQSRVFANLTTKAEACSILQGPRGDDMAARARQQLLALWLNVVSGLVDMEVPIHLKMTSAATVGQAIAEVESILLTPSGRADLERAKDICDALNNGMR